MKHQVSDFMAFVRQQGVVGLAVGLAIGTQVGDAVKAIVNGFIDPVVGFLVGSQKGLESAKWTVVDTAERSLVIGWGAVLSALITLVAVAAVIYYVVHGLRLDRIDKKKEEAVDNKKDKK